LQTAISTLNELSGRKWVRASELPPPLNFACPSGHIAGFTVTRLVRIPPSSKEPDTRVVQCKKCHRQFKGVFTFDTFVLEPCGDSFTEIAGLKQTPVKLYFTTQPETK
jgi:hypothetical protein